MSSKIKSHRPCVIWVEWPRSELADWCVLQSGVFGAGVESHTTMGCGCVDFTGEARISVGWVSAKLHFVHIICAYTNKTQTENYYGKIVRYDVFESMY